MKSTRSSTMSAPPATASAISTSAAGTVRAITLVVSAHVSPLKAGAAPAEVTTAVLEEEEEATPLPRRAAAFELIIAIGSLSAVEEEEERLTAGPRCRPAKRVAAAERV